MSPRRWILLALILLASLAAGGAIAFTPFVRAQAQQRALRYGASLHIGYATPALFGVRLHNVRVSVPDLPSLSLELEEVFVEYNHLSIQGGSATIDADRKTFAQQMTQWRSKRGAASSAAAASSPSSTEVSLRGLALVWSGVDGPGSSLHIENLRVDDLLGARTVRIEKIKATHPKGWLRGEHIQVAWSHDKPAQINSLLARRLAADLQLGESLLPMPKPPAAAASATAPSASISAAPTVVAPDVNPKAASAKKTASPAPAPEPLPALRDRLARLATIVWAPMSPDAKVEIDAFEVLLHRGQEKINLGPGVLAAQHKDSAVLIDLAPRVEAGKKGISFRASVPTQRGPVILDIVGGPISLATLGVKDKNLGLTHVNDALLTADAHLKLHAGGKHLSFDGAIRARNVSVQHARLAPRAVRGLELAVKARGQVALDGSFLHVDEGEVDIGEVQIRLRGTVDRTRPKARVDVHFGIPLVGCQAFLDALPKTLVPVVHGMTAAGTLSLSGHLRYDEENLKEFLLEYAPSNDCRITSVPPAVDARRFQGQFERTVYDAKGDRVRIEAGPGTAGWVARSGINHFMEAAVMTCEDGRFRRHRGFDHEAIRNSAQENLKAGKFIRGASTISMQLAKNLYLGREKTISRKLQELILTTYLEQTLTKDQIMTLYLNVIEFGPMTYGVGNAASRYFNKHPVSLSLGQAMYLASILPSPDRQHFVQDGRVSEGWMRYLYKLMGIARKMGWITELELDYGRGEWVVYGSPDPVRVAPEPDEDQAVPGQEQAGPEEEPFGWKQRGDSVY